ncbi:MAG: hypothetical protein GX220_06515, partial [Treponema sp.]|nr:hypothetical protein [Treponema sp.]
MVNSNFGPLNKFGASRQEIASKTATSHMREPLGTTLIKDRNMTNSEFKQAAKKHQVSWREQNIRKEYNTYVT